MRRTTTRSFDLIMSIVAIVVRRWCSNWGGVHERNLPTLLYNYLCSCQHEERAFRYFKRTSPDIGVCFLIPSCAPELVPNKCSPRTTHHRITAVL